MNSSISHEAASAAPALDVRELSVVHSNRQNRALTVVAVDRVSLTVGRGEVVGVVGESGSGKTSLAMTVAGLGTISNGSIAIRGQLLHRQLTPQERAEIQVVLQDPHGSLDPRQSVRGGLRELRQIHPARTAWITDEQLLAKVGLGPEILDRLPHAISGGQAQRVAIARALLLRPSVLIADEPTSALDVSVQAQILSLLLELRNSEGLSILFISHDLGVVRSICDRVHVMLNGRVVESGPVEQVFDHPAHSYTRRLIDAIPGRRRAQAAGEASDAAARTDTAGIAPEKSSLRKLARFSLRVVGHAVTTLLIAVTIAFLLARASGDPVHEVLGDMASEEQIAQLRQRLGLDKSLPGQYIDFLGHLASGDLGTSLRYDTSNLELILSRLPSSIILAAGAISLGILFGIPLGIVASLNEGRAADRVASGLALIGESIPLFWLGLMLILVFAVQLKWLPAGQAGSVSSLILPALTLSTLPTAQIARLTRSSLTEVLGETFISAARARGISAFRTVFVHAFRNASLPVLTIIGLQTGALLSGAVTVEYVFAWPGLGTLATQAVANRDFALIQSLVVFGASIFVIVNVIVDILYGLLDPRIREGER